MRHIIMTLFAITTNLDQVFARVREGRRAMAGQATGQSACMSFIEAADRQL